MQDTEHLVGDREELTGKQDRVVSLDEHAPTPEQLDPAISLHDGNRWAPRVCLCSGLPSGDEIGPNTGDLTPRRGFP